MGVLLLHAPLENILVIWGDDHSGQGQESLGVYNLRANFVVVHVHLQRHGASVFAISYEDCHNFVACYYKQRILRSYSYRIPTGGFTKENKNIGICD